MTEHEFREAFHAAARLSLAARQLMQTVDHLDRPSDSYSILGNLLDNVRSLEMVLGQFADWHRSVQPDRHFHQGHDDSTIGIQELKKARRIPWPALVPRRLHLRDCHVDSQESTLAN